MGRKKSQKLTTEQKQMLAFIPKFTNEHGYPPTFREIEDQVGFSSPSVVHYNADRLEELGLVTRDRNIPRSIRVVQPVVQQIQEKAVTLQRTVQELLCIPVIGLIVAGQPVPVPASDFSYFDAETTVDIAPSMLPGRIKTPGQIYALRVQGDSMIDDMVNDGDIIIMQPAIEANNGDMIAVWLPDEEATTFKRFFREKDRIRLQPANPTMDPIYIPKNQSIQIQGKILLVISQK
jgi:repressor LexA